MASGCQSTPSNLRPPGTDNCRHGSPWFTPETLIQKAAEERIFGQVDDFAGMEDNSAGSRLSQVKVPTTNPIGPSPAELP